MATSRHSMSRKLLLNCLVEHVAVELVSVDEPAVVEIETLVDVVGFRPSELLIVPEVFAAEYLSIG